MKEITEEELYRGFSSPIETLDESFMLSLAGEYATSVVELFLDSFKDSLPRVSSGVVELLEGLAAAGPEFEAIWSPAVGRCLNAIRAADDALARRAAAEFLLHAGANGVVGDWEIQLAKPYVFLWDAWKLPESDFLAVKHDGKGVQILTRNQGEERRVVFRPDDGELRWRSDEAELLPHVNTGRGTVVFLPRRAINPENYDDFGFPLIPEITPRQFEPFAKAFALLKERLPSFHEWVARVLRQVVIVQAGPHKYLLSGSDEGMFAVVYISDSPDILSLAEMLVHEASHQYFYLVTRLGPPHDPSSEQMFYSPFVNSMRHLDRILMAYHAFGNVYVFYRSYLGLDEEAREVCLKRMGRTLEDLKSVEGHIRDSSELTPIGSALAEPLLRELRDAQY